MSLTCSQEFEVVQSVDLVPGGSEIAVTADNRHECTSGLYTLAVLTDRLTRHPAGL